MVRILRSTIIDAPVDRVWGLLRDFNGHEDWHPAVAQSEIENGLLADQVGCVRRFRLRDADGGLGQVLREQLLALSDAERSFTYCILAAPFPLNDYVATVALKPVTDGEATLWCWECEFEPPADRAAELTELVADGIYQAGFDAVRGLLSGAGERRAGRLRVIEGGQADVAAPAYASGAMMEGRGIVLTAHGGPEQLRLQAVTAAPPGPGEVRIRQSRIGVNFIDVYCRTGYFDLLSPPGVPGMEAAGQVVDVGANVHHLLPGDRVGYAAPPVGAYADLRTMPAAHVVPLPDDIDDETAAAGLLKGITADFLLHRVHTVKPGDWVLVHAAAGGVGLLLCQWARALGAKVIGTVGSAEKARLARDHGCAWPIPYREQDFVAAVMEITQGRGVDVAYDAVGADTFRRSFEALATFGHLVSFGQASGDIGPVDVAGFAAKSARLSRPNYGHYVADPNDLRASVDRLFAAIRCGTLTVAPQHRYPLAEAAQAHADLEGRRTSGAIVLLAG
ncbi:zinc-binding dehydrogenase [Marinibaculum pumilum]|uniref:Zinc-binding dehydrogenase n=1 Tax=Marinibaculum pumilum TaxID=1766165 RepID=A0ABV7KVB8_9PROT